MLILLVRHGHAGSKQAWTGDDRLRPLSERGRTEADALVGVLRPYSPGRIVSSPLIRCVETVEPLATALGLAVETSDALSPDAREPATIVARRVPGIRSDAVVLCTHGEVIEDMQARISKDLATIFGNRPARPKASVWLLGREQEHFVAATYIPPPGVRA